jgi:hypothetical protein
MANKTFTQSISVSGTSNSFAWNAPSNWIGGALPVIGDRLIIGPSTAPNEVSYDNLNFGGPLQALQVSAGAPLVDIASGITLNLSGPLINYGTVSIESGAQLAARRLQANGSITDAGTLEVPDFIMGSFAFQGSNADIFLSSPQPIWHNVSTAPVTGFETGDALFLAKFVLTQQYYPTYSAFFSGTTLTINGVNNTGEKSLYQLANFQPAADVSGFNASVVSLPDPLTGVVTSFLEVTAVCFVGGTRIATDQGDIQVENLREGTQVITVAGAARPVRWVGHRQIDLTNQKRPESLYPVRIHAGAFADRLPQRDLLVSPDHCLFVDGQLVPAKLLINGMSVTQDRSLRTVQYYHVELDTHDVVLAEGLPAETYLDTGNRGFFVNSGGPADLHPTLDLDENRLRWREQLYAPLCLRSAEIEPVWARLVARAEAMNYVRPGVVVTGDPGLRLLAGGREYKPVAQTVDRYSFILPAGARDMRVLSRSSVPADVTPKTDDWRRLGVAIRTILVRSTTGELVNIPADNPSLSDGWHSAETGADGPWRWTDGDAGVGLPLLSGMLTVELTLAGPATYRVDSAILDRLVA